MADTRIHDRQPRNAPSDPDDSMPTSSATDAPPHAQGDVGGVSLPECIVCGRHKEHGIYICGEFICESCERDIVTTDVEDARYGYFVECMRRIWFHG